MESLSEMSSIPRVLWELIAALEDGMSDIQVARGKNRLERGSLGGEFSLSLR